MIALNDFVSLRLYSKKTKIYSLIIKNYNMYSCTTLSLSRSFLSSLTAGVEFLELGPSNLKLPSPSSWAEKEKKRKWCYEIF